MNASDCIADIIAVATSKTREQFPWVVLPTEYRFSAEERQVLWTEIETLWLTVQDLSLVIHLLQSADEDARDSEVSDVFCVCEQSTTECNLEAVRDVYIGRLTLILSQYLD